MSLKEESKNDDSDKGSNQGHHENRISRFLTNHRIIKLSSSGHQNRNIKIILQNIQLRIDFHPNLIPISLQRNRYADFQVSDHMPFQIFSVRHQ